MHWTTHENADFKLNWLSQAQQTQWPYRLHGLCCRWFWSMSFCACWWVGALSGNIVLEKMSPIESEACELLDQYSVSDARTNYCGRWASSEPIQVIVTVSLTNNLSLREEEWHLWFLLWIWSTRTESWPSFIMGRSIRSISVQAKWISSVQIGHSNSHPKIRCIHEHRVFYHICLFITGIFGSKHAEICSIVKIRCLAVFTHYQCMSHTFMYGLYSSGHRRILRCICDT